MNGFFLGSTYNRPTAQSTEQNRFDLPEGNQFLDRQTKPLDDWQSERKTDKEDKEQEKYKDKHRKRQTDRY